MPHVRAHRGGTRAPTDHRPEPRPAQVGRRRGRRGGGEGPLALQAPHGVASAVPDVANRSVVHMMRCVSFAVLLAVCAVGCSDDAAPAFDEDAVVAYVHGLNVTGTTSQLDTALVEDARNICTRELDDGTIALIKISIGQGTDRILRAGCPDRVDEVLAKG